MTKSNTPPPTHLGTIINGMTVIYRDEEACQVGAGDVLIVFAHGADDNPTLADNAGHEVTREQMMDLLGQVDAEFASAVYFFACYSALPHHIAPTFKTYYNGIRVFGSDEPAQGALVATTRTGRITRAVWSTGQLREIEQND